MKLHEYQAKKIFAKYGIPIPNGYVCRDANDVRETKDVVIKAQVLVGGRGKAGGIKFAKGTREARGIVREMLSSSVKGLPVNSVLIEDRLDIEKELYVGFTIDRSAKVPVLIASSEGGIDIESVPEDKLVRMYIDPLIGLQDFMARNMAMKLGIPDIAEVAKSLYSVFVDYDATLAEINPLVLTKNRKLIAADAVLDVDDDALYRQKLKKGKEAGSKAEEKAREMGIAFVKLDGNVGVIANGAGLTMATLDALAAAGGAASAFLDLGGTDNPEKVKSALMLIRETKPDAVFVNIFGGLTKCDTIARALGEELAGIDMPVVVRLKGNNEVEGNRLLREKGINAFTDMDAAVKKVVEVVNVNNS